VRLRARTNVLGNSPAPNNRGGSLEKQYNGSHTAVRVVKRQWAVVIPIVVVVLVAQIVVVHELPETAVGVVFIVVLLRGSYIQQHPRIGSRQQANGQQVKTKQKR
jgi:hypothetical protein